MQPLHNVLPPCVCLCVFVFIMLICVFVCSVCVPFSSPAIATGVPLSCFPSITPRGSSSTNDSARTLDVCFLPRCFNPRVSPVSCGQRVATEEAYCNVIGFSSEAQFFRRALENVRFVDWRCITCAYTQYIRTRGVLKSLCFHGCFACVFLSQGVPVYDIGELSRLGRDNHTRCGREPR